MNKKKKVNVRELVNRHQENCDRIQEIADACENEQRERTEAEEAEYRSLTRDNELIRMKIQAINAPAPVEPVSPTVQLREIVNGANPNGKVSIMFMRDVDLMTTAGVADTGIIPVSEQEMMKPLRTGLIYDKVGINIRTGLAAGTLRWPMHTKAIGQFADEGERLTDSKVEFDKLTVTPRRLGIAIPVTREDLESSQGVVESVIREEMPAAITDLINEAMFTTSSTFTDKAGANKDRVVYGPFVEAAKKPFEFAAEIPTRRELIKMKAQVISAGIKLTHPCWVMTENMKAELEDTKVDAGSGRFVCENDTVLGYPVFTTPEIGEGKVSIMFMRDVDLMTTAGVADTGIIPVSEQEMMKPLRTGLIYDKVGINIRTGLAAGTLRWPMHTKAIGQFADEGERLTDSKVEFDKLTVTPRRLGIAIPVTREDLESSQGVVESVIREEMPAAITDLINEAMFTTSSTFTDKAGANKDRVVYGPFVEAAKKPFEFAAEIPTRRELIKMKAQVISAGIKLTHPCWVMTENMKAELEDTKVDAGSGRFVCENDTVLGYPVFTTPEIGEGNIGFGDWSYQAAGFFGTTSLIVDPYTLARQNSTDFVLNAHFATVTLRKDAFVLGHKKGASAGA